MNSSAKNTDSDVIAEIERGSRMLSSPSSDRRWQGAILVGEFCESHPELVWPVVLRWGCSRRADTRTAVACCILEHLLEHHFSLYFERVTTAVLAGHPLLGDTVSSCWLFGQSATAAHNRRFHAFTRTLNTRRA